jgi:diguanylate cyclase (GGDEF)-like protein
LIKLTSYLINVLIFFCCIIISFYIEAAEQQPARAIDSDTLELNGQWRFCPVDRFDPNADINQLRCYDISIPGPWESVIPDYDGFGLLMSQFKLPAYLHNKHLAFFASHIRDADKVFINGKLIGETGEFPPEFEKAVFYSRLYSIPLNLINPNQTNTIAMWIYNDARPGGIFSNVPVIATFETLINKRHNINYMTYSLIIVLLVFSLFNFINYIFNIKTLENLYFGVFLLCWSIYIFSASDLVLLTSLPLNLVFRANIILFFIIFSSFILFIYTFFKKTTPLTIKIMIWLIFIFISICTVLPQPKQLYVFVTIVEVFAIPSLFFIFHLLYKVNTAKLAYARIMSVVLVLYLTFGSSEIIMDAIYANEAGSYSPLGPWLLIILSICLTLIVSHKNMSYYRKATFDGLTGVLRFENFKERLKRLISRVQREKKALVVLMVDLDDFKKINDRFGHMQGDKVLVLISDTMRNEMSHFDLLARYGGDEFCIAVMMDNREDLQVFTQELHQKLNKLNIQLDESTIDINTTVGATFVDYKQASVSSDELIDQADKLLIKAKINTKGQVLW